MKDILISIKPEHANRIMSGEKKIELRRKFPESAVSGALPQRMIIYSSSPVRAIIGEVLMGPITRFKQENVAFAYRVLQERACVDEKAFHAYFDGLGGVGIVVHKPILYSTPITLDEMRKLGIQPPQSWRYLPDAIYTRIEEIASCYQREWPLKTDAADLRLICRPYQGKTLLAVDGVVAELNHSEVLAFYAAFQEVVEELSIAAASKRGRP